MAPFSLLVLTILAMLSQAHSEASPSNTVNSGAEFVATLRLFYPHADSLCEKDFDWLFDCPQTKQFLDWFCRTVSEENVLSPAEVDAYEALLAAGKPILEGDALEQALQTCLQVPQLPSMIPEDVEALRQELQELKDYRDRLLWRHNKLQVLTANLHQELRYLEEEEKVVQQDLKEAQADLQVEIFQTSAVLCQISKAAKQLAEWYEGKGQPPALMCEMDLGPYMELEQQATDAFQRFIQQVLPGSVWAPDVQGASALGESSLKESLEAGTRMDSDWEILEGTSRAPYQECAKTPWLEAPASQGILVQGLRAELLSEGRNGREVLSMEDDEERDGSQEATETMDTKQTMMPKSLGTDGDELLQDQDSFWKELSQIEKARICAQREVIVMSAKVEGNCAALEWVERTLEALEENQVGPVLPFLHHPLQQGLPVLWQSLLSNAGAQLTWQEGLAELAMHPDTRLSCHLPAQHAVKAELLRQAAVLQKKLHAQRCDIMETLTHQLPPLLRAEARLSLLPVLQRQLSLEAAHLQDIEGRQQKAAAWLASQHSRLELLELQLKRERKQLDQRAAQLGEMAMAMREAQTRLQEQQEYFRDASSSQNSCTRIWIDPKDLSAVR